MAIFTVNITRIMIKMIVIVMMSVALASDPCGAQIILLRLLLLLMMMMMMMMSTTVLYQCFGLMLWGKWR